MSTSSILIVLGAFLASAVEMVEALTIVLAVGIVRGWRSTLIGVGAAARRPGRARRRARPGAEPCADRRAAAVVGALLLVFGLQWLRKAILRSSGYKALHDEDEAFRRGARAGRERRRRAASGARLVRVHGRVQGRPARGARGRLHRDRLRQRPGAARARRRSAPRRPWSSSSSPGVLARGPLARVPENTIKFAVGLLLTSFGCFWARRGRRRRLARRRRCRCSA